MPPFSIQHSPINSDNGELTIPYLIVLFQYLPIWYEYLDNRIFVPALIVTPPPPLHTHTHTHIHFFYPPALPTWKHPHPQKTRKTTPASGHHKSWHNYQIEPTECSNSNNNNNNNKERERKRKKGGRKREGKKDIKIKK